MAIISGGGSGHEPLHGGDVEHGTLDAACPEEIFTAPTPDQICDAPRKACGGRGEKIAGARGAREARHRQKWIEGADDRA